MLTAMSVRSFEGKMPSIGKETYIHPSADVFGDVVIGERCWIGPGARIRGDYGTIVIGSGCAIEDNCVIHARPGDRTRIGDWVTLGHGAIVHNAVIGDWATIGMGGIVSDWAVVGEWAVIAEGAVVQQSMTVPDRGIAVGVPARIIEKQVDEKYREQWTRFKEMYADLARRYALGLGPSRA
jgi:carbonic anhydrase/acetyltransferase-like protein (isoleucine patch superfamily)